MPSLPKAGRRRERSRGLLRNLSGGRNARRTIDLIESNTEFSEGWSQQLDIRLSSNVNVRGVRFVPNLAIFNLFNEDSVLQTQARIGRTFQNARNILGARTIKLGAQIHF